jgi:hypothetical protein
LGHKGNHYYLASIELIDAADNSRREKGCNLMLQIFNHCAKQVVQRGPKRILVRAPVNYRSKVGRQILKQCPNGSTCSIEMPLPPGGVPTPDPKKPPPITTVKTILWAAGRRRAAHAGVPDCKPYSLPSRVAELKQPMPVPQMGAGCPPGLQHVAHQRHVHAAVGHASAGVPVAFGLVPRRVVL